MSRHINIKLLLEQRIIEHTWMEYKTGVKHEAVLHKQEER